MNPEPGPLAIAIVAHRPDAGLAELVRTLAGAAPVLLVDDGGGPEYRDIFARAAAIPGVQVLRHAVERGQCVAWQTAINHALCTWENLAGLVTADCGIDSADEILRALRGLRANGDSVIEGESGIRGLPAALLPELLRVESSGFESAIRKAAASSATAVSASSLEPAGAIRPIAWLIALVFAVLVGVEIHGFRSTTLFTPDIWFPVGLKRFTRFGAEYLALSVPLLAMVPWTFAGVVTVLMLLLTAISVGPVPLLVVALFLLSSCALGSRLIGQYKHDSITTDLCATLLGSGVYVFLMIFAARLPVNYPLVWGIVLAIPVLADLRGVRLRITRWIARIQSMELRSPGERIGLALLVFILIAQWFGAMMPETSADGLAMHLAIPMNVAANHRMTFEPSRYLWSVMPMGADWLYTIVLLLGGEYAARILNYAMFLVLVALLYRAMRRWVTPAAAYVLAASFAATPVVQFVTGSLFVENFLVALVLGMMTALWQFGDTGQKRFLYLSAALGGTAMSTKYGALVFIALLLPFAIVEVRRHWKSLGPRPWAVCALVLLLLIAMAAPTYVIAYEKTGNPIFPFLNPKIHSPLLNPTVSIVDERFRIPLDWKSLYVLTFHTSKAYEGQDGSFGFQYIVVIPLALLGLLVAKGRAARAAAVIGIGAGAVILQSTPNVRYLYTSMPLLLIAFAALLGWVMANQRWMYRLMLAYIFVAASLNAYFIPSSNYYHKEFCLRFPFSKAERQRFLEDAAPERKVVAYFNRVHPNAAVLLTSTTAIAGLNADIYENNWHQFSILEQLRAAPTPPDMLRLIERWKVEYFIVEKLPAGDETVPPTLQALIDACTSPELVAREFTLARLDAKCNPPADMVPTPTDREISPADQVVVTAGAYDDFDKAIAFHADWWHDRSFEGAYSHTVSYSDTEGASVSIAFQGTSLTYVFTSAPNRGIASVTVDDGDAQNIDLYSAKVEWQAKRTFCCFAEGRHRAVITVTGKGNAKSSGKFVDVDAFEVK